MRAFEVKKSCKPQKDLVFQYFVGIYVLNYGAAFSRNFSISFELYRLEPKSSVLEDTGPVWTWCDKLMTES